ncbi:hypothetical protein SAMN04244548_02982 [Paracoccus pantotrophus]|nr:hypothetical protein SAMN04244548_02982 [Paracoccus pantotrophus]
MADGSPIRLTYADHVLIHACGVFLADPCADDRDGMIQSILTDVLPDVTRDNPALIDFIVAAREFIKLPTAELRAARAGKSAILRNFHMRRMAAAWDQIREQYVHDDDLVE